MNALIGLLIVILAEPIAKIFTNEIAVLSIAMPIFVWVAVALVTDGGQAVVANALRGRRDVWIASIIQGLTFLGLMVPLTWFLAFPYGNGAIGLFQGVLIAATLSNVFLGSRVQYLYVIDRKRK